MIHLYRAACLALASFGFVSVFVAAPSVAAETDSLPIIAAPALSGAPILSLDAAVLAPQDDFSTASDRDDARPQTLAALVDDQATADTTGDEQTCLAASVYYESKGEPLAGQLAVAETVINRAQSGRFPDSICGVVRQPGQFSFVRGGQVPSAPKASRAWAVAVAIARIAQADMIRDVAPKALYFHASRVRPGWSGAKRIAQFGNHIFYR